MKKTLIIIAAILGFAVAASAQPKAIGGRFGATGLEASYQHYLGNPNFLEVDLGFYMFNGFNATGTYNWTFAQPNWSSRGEWGWYAGPGINLGVYDSNFFIGAVGQVGLEYTFWFPLQLSVDLRPTIGVYDGEFFTDGLAYGFIPSFSVRYAF